MPPFRLFAVAVIGMLVLCAPLLAGRHAAAPQRLVVAGSTTMAPLLRAAARRFEQRYPGVAIDVRADGTAAGLAAVRSGTAAIGMVSRSLTDAERDLYGLPIARDGVVVVVHRSNPVTRLTQAQLQAVFGGTASQWRQVGGGKGAIHVVAASAGAGSNALFADYLGLRDDVVAAARFPSNDERIATVLKNPAAITYVSMGEAERRVAAGEPLRLLPIDGIWANSKNVRSGDYPISRPLTLVSRGAPVGVAREFFKYCGSAQIDELVARYEFVPYLD